MRAYAEEIRRALLWYIHKASAAEAYRLAEAMDVIGRVLNEMAAKYDGQIEDDEWQAIALLADAFLELRDLARVAAEEKEREAQEFLRMLRELRELHAKRVARRPR